jgi:CMP/dCMP kinase
MRRVIAIDGPSGAGKSTVARLLADRLGFSYLDTGALYRAVAFLFRERGISPEDDDKRLSEVLAMSGIRCNGSRISVDSRDISEEIRTPEIGHYSSVFSARKVVRDFLLDVQRNAPLHSDLVAEGRDTTTVVFPGAWKKFYLEGSQEERTKRRYMQLKGEGITASESDAASDIAERDIRDSTRAIAPLLKAKDAIIVDTTGKTVDEVLELILGYVRSDP